MKNNRRLFFLFAIIFHFTFLNAHNDKDSLLEVYHHSNNVNDRIKAYCKLINLMLWEDKDSARQMLDSAERWVSRKGNVENKSRLINLKGNYQWMTGNLDSAMHLYRQVLEFSIINDLPDQYAMATSNMGALFNSLGQLDSASIYLHKTLAMNQKKNDNASIAKNLYDLGTLYNKRDYEHLALEYLLLSADYFVKEQDSVKTCFAFTSLGTTYQKIKDFEKSKEYILKAIEYDLAIDEINILSDLYNNLGVTYWLVKHDFDSARIYFTESIKHSNNFENNINKKYAFLINVGGMESDAKNYARSLALLKEAQQLKLSYPNDYLTSALLINLGNILYSTGSRDSARHYLNKGLELAVRIKANAHIRNAYKNLYDIDSTMGNWRSALAYYKLTRDYADSIDNENVRNKIAELEIIHETAEKQKENELLKVRNTLNENIIHDQRMLLTFSLVSLTIIIIILFLLLEKHRQLNNANEQLLKKGEEIRKKQEEIELKNANLEKQKKELEELNQTKDKFFSIIAHDLRSPFNAILGFLDLLENDFDQLNDEEKLNIIKQLHLGSQNSYDLLINLLDWSRSQRGLIQNNPQPFDLHQLAMRVYGVLNTRAMKKEHTFKNAIAPGLMVYADPNLTEQILINLINNSIKFTARGGHISVSASCDEEHIRVVVSDTGIGIPAEKIDEIFSISSGFNRKGTENELGTGLGLNLCREYTFLMGGTITVDSQENEGTTFTINIPVVKQP